MSSQTSVEQASSDSEQRSRSSRSSARPAWSPVSLVSLASFVFLLGKALRVLPVGPAHAVWTGIGAVVMGTVLFGEASSAGRITGVVLVVAGIVTLRAAT